MGTCDWAGFIRHYKGQIDSKRTAVRARCVAAACFWRQHRRLASEVFTIPRGPTYQREHVKCKPSTLLSGDRDSK
jgi:hypothetical protein